MYVTEKATGMLFSSAFRSASAMGSFEIASIAVPIVADSVSAPATSPAAVPAS